MEEEKTATVASEIGMWDRVQFSSHGRWLTGTVVYKGRTAARVVVDEHHEVRVPYPRLVRIPGSGSAPVYRVSQQQRMHFHAGDAVRFPYQGSVRHGTLARLNPTRALVIGEDGKDYRVPYALLTRGDNTEAPLTTPQTVSTLEAVAQLARDLLAVHHLGNWSFQFDHGTKRAGCCHYATHVIALSQAFALHAPAQEIRDTLLHEIAHALVGQAHHHDAVWRAQALAMGCSGQRRHAVQFTPPRYIMKCTQGCWVATAERRLRRALCKRCRG